MTPQSTTATPDGLAPSTTERLSADDALAELVAGNRRFVAGQPRYGHQITAAAAASGVQRPDAVVVGCIDSRVPLEAIFDQNFGSICVVRSGAHVLDQAVLGSVEFAVTELAVPLVVVLGHERCGAIAATVEALRRGRTPTGALGYLVKQIAPAVVAAGIDAEDVYSRALRLHTQHTVEELQDEIPLARAMRHTGVRIVGAVYDLDTGVVDLL
ncbi:carbonic anhydrase [Allocatelliglobosispora scoriae]|uniref:Carbonic anhydrase n=1 Tax=Allocatelliglobosispora scoriae TaxID=643052 RepID=A0A841BS06_9ACTN|nr:carbonic anhydrase [Allocatelliglobosispora scoriae]MBB5869580.1 carbonic anhydrase [Allocatelliglobosispora scoriae]